MTIKNDRIKKFLKKNKKISMITLGFHQNQRNSYSYYYFDAKNGNKVKQKNIKQAKKSLLEVCFLCVQIEQLVGAILHQADQLEKKKQKKKEKKKFKKIVNIVVIIQPLLDELDACCNQAG